MHTLSRRGSFGGALKKIVNIVTAIPTVLYLLRDPRSSILLSNISCEIMREQIYDII